MFTIDYLPCNLRWMESYLKNLDFYQHTTYATQQLQFDIASVMSKLAVENGAVEQG